MVSFSFFVDPRCIYDTDLLQRLYTSLEARVKTESTIRFYFSHDFYGKNFYTVLVHCLRALKRNFPDKILQFYYVWFECEKQKKLHGQEQPMKTSYGIDDTLQDICKVKSIQVSIYSAPNSKSSAFWKRAYQWLYEKSKYAVCYFYNLLLPNLERSFFVPLSSAPKAIYIGNPDMRNKIKQASKELSTDKRRAAFLAFASEKSLREIAIEQQCTKENVNRQIMYARWEIMKLLSIQPADALQWRTNENC